MVLVVLGSVLKSSLGLFKNWQLNQTATNLDQTVVASPRGFAICLIVVAVAQAKIKNWLQPVQVRYIYIYILSMYCTG